MTYLWCRFARPGLNGISATQCGPKILLRPLTAALPRLQSHTDAPATTMKTLARSPIAILQDQSNFIRNFDPELVIHCKTSPVELVEQLPRNGDYQSKINDIFSEYLPAERNFNLNLTPEDQQRLGSEGQSPSFAAANFGAQFEMLATLTGKKPCVLIYIQNHDLSPNPRFVFDRLARSVLLPLFQKYRLDQYGYIFRKITHDVMVLETGENFCGAWILADNRSKRWKETQNIFLNPEERYHTVSAVGDALGYPVLYALPNFDTRYVYKDMTYARELEEITREKVEVLGLDYRASSDPEQERIIHEHFEDYRRIGAKYGREYVLWKQEIPLEGLTC
jgi:hypothetical protein